MTPAEHYQKLIAEDAGIDVCALPPQAKAAYELTVAFLKHPALPDLTREAKLRFLHQYKTFMDRDKEQLGELYDPMRRAIFQVFKSIG